MNEYYTSHGQFVIVVSHQLLKSILASYLQEIFKNLGHSKSRVLDQIVNKGLQHLLPLIKIVLVEVLSILGSHRRNVESWEFPRKIVPQPEKVTVSSLDLKVDWFSDNLKDYVFFEDTFGNLFRTMI